MGYVFVQLAHKTLSVIPYVGQKSHKEKATLGWVLRSEGKQDLRGCSHRAPIDNRQLFASEGATLSGIN